MKRHTSPIKNSPMMSAERLGDLLHGAASTTISHFSALFSSALAGLVAGIAKAARAESTRVMRVDEMNFILEIQTVKLLG
jgi:hypothetical protein